MNRCGVCRAPIHPDSLTPGDPNLCSFCRQDQAALVRLHATELLTALQELVSLSPLIPQRADHDGLRLCDALARARNAISKATKK